MDMIFRSSSAIWNISINVRDSWGKLNCFVNSRHSQHPIENSLLCLHSTLCTAVSIAFIQQLLLLLPGFLYKALNALWPENMHLCPNSLEPIPIQEAQWYSISKCSLSAQQEQHLESTYKAPSTVLNTFCVLTHSMITTTHETGLVRILNLQMRNQCVCRGLIQNQHTERRTHTSNTTLSAFLESPILMGLFNLLQVLENK